MEQPLSRFESPRGGIPWYQQVVMRLYLGPFVSSRATTQANNRAFKKLTQKILDLAADLPERQHTTQVMVPPQIGLEESSRYWSVSMTLEHLLTVTRGMQAVIEDLSQGIKPEGEVSLARLKPKGERGPGDIYSEFEEFMRGVPEASAKALATNNSTVTYAHPWFGEMTAKQWHWLMVAHLAIHYRQLKNIRRGLPFEV